VLDSGCTTSTLPKLHAAGLVEWDRAADEVAPTPLGRRLPVEFLRPATAATSESDRSSGTGD
jgi:hypothetical protein